MSKTTRSHLKKSEARKIREGKEEKGSKEELVNDTLKIILL